MHRRVGRTRNIRCGRMECENERLTMLWELTPAAMNEKLVSYMTGIRDCAGKSPASFQDAVSKLNIIYVIANEALLEVEDNKNAPYKRNS